jgi:cytochrome P450
MRIHPATGFILERTVPKDGVTMHGVHLPEGTVVGVNAWALHYNKDVFGPDVHAFRPERWIEGDEEKIKDMKRNMIAVSGLRFSFSFPFLRGVKMGK